VCVIERDGVCVCVCERERVRERGGVCVCEREQETARRSTGWMRATSATRAASPPTSRSEPALFAFHTQPFCISSAGCEPRARKFNPEPMTAGEQGGAAPARGGDRQRGVHGQDQDWHGRRRFRVLPGSVPELNPTPQKRCLVASRPWRSNRSVLIIAFPLV